MFASSQIYLRPNTSYGLQLYRIAPDSILHLPKINDLLLHTTYTTLPQLRTIGDSLWFYNGTYWVNMNRIATAGSATWGGIGGVITDQLDLIARFGTKVDTGRTITINGITQSLSANRTYTVGTVDSVSVGPLNPLFTTTVATNSTHPIVVFSQISQPAYTIFGNNAGSSAVPSFFIPTLASAMFQNQGSATTVLHGNAAGNPSWAAVNLATDVTGTLPGTSVGFTANQSVIITGSNITLKNDQATPDTFNFYGTDSVAALGYHPSQPSQLTDPQDNDDVKVKFISGRPFFVNQPSINQCQTRWVSGLDVTRIGTTHSFFVSPGQYYIGCDLKTWNGGLVTIPDVVSLPKQTWIIVDANGANIVDGTENADPQLESLNLDTQIPRASVLVNADNSIDVSQLVIYNENTESTMATGGTITVNFGSAGNTANGSVKIAVTAAANNAYWQATYASILHLSDYNDLSFYIQNVAALNANSNWSIQLYNNNTAVSQEVLLTDNGYTRGINASAYQHIVIRREKFTGGNDFNRVRVRRKGTGGTINTRFDWMYLETGMSSPPAVAPPSTQIVTNVASLRALNVTGEVLANTLGYYLANDGGGAQYYWDGASVAADDGFLIIKSINATGRWKLLISDRINLRWAGAKGDGATDDRPAFIKVYNALAAPYSTMVVPDGLYQMSDSIYINKNIGITGLGSGIGRRLTTIFRFAANKKGLVVKFETLGATTFNMQNMWIQGGGGTDTLANGIWTNTVILLDNVTESDFSGKGVVFDSRVTGNTDLSVLRGLNISQNLLEGLWIAGGDGNKMRFYDLTSSANGRSGVWDNGFLGNDYFSPHVAVAGMLQGQKSWVTHGGLYFVFTALIPAAGIEPEVTSGWQNTWAQFPGVDVPSVVSAWSGGTTYFPCVGFAIVGANSYANVTSLYSEGGQGGTIARGYSQFYGGDQGAGFVQWQPYRNFIGSDGPGVFFSDADFIVHDATEPLNYSGLRRDAGLFVGSSGMDGVYTKANRSDTSVHVMEQNSSGFDILTYALQGKSGSLWGVPTIQNQGRPTWARYGFNMKDSLGTYARNISGTLGFDAIIKTPHAGGDYALNIGDNDSTWYKYYSGAWHYVGGGGGGGGGGGSDSPDRINGTATGDVTADMGNNKFWITQSGGNSIHFASDDGSGNSSFFSMNGSGWAAAFNDNEFDIDATGIRTSLDGTNTFTGLATDTTNYIGESYVQRDWVLDHINNAGGVSLSGTNTWTAVNTFSNSIIAGSISTGTTTIPLTVNAASGHNTYLMALGKNNNSAYFRIDKDGNISDIGGGAARIQTSAGKPYFPDGLVFTSVVSPVDANSLFQLGQGAAFPWFFDNRNSTTASQDGITVAQNNAGTKGNYARFVDASFNDRFVIDPTAKIMLWNTITTGGTTGAQTINKPSGTVNIAAAGTSVVVTNSTCTTSSIVYAVLRTNDATATIKNIVPGSGSFTITLNAAATAEVSIGFIVFN